MVLLGVAHFSISRSSTNRDQISETKQSRSVLVSLTRHGGYICHGLFRIIPQQEEVRELQQIITMKDVAFAVWSARLQHVESAFEGDLPWALCCTDACKMRTPLLAGCGSPGLLVELLYFFFCSDPPGFSLQDRIIRSLGGQQMQARQRVGFGSYS